MVETSFNLFDMIVLTMVGLSALLSFFRGFIREILSLGAWVIAALITLYSFLDVAAMIEPQVSNSVIASGLAAMITFIASLMLMSIINALLMRILKKGKDVGPLDNALGLVFGVLRAMLLLSFGYFAFGIVTAEDDMPDWIKYAQTRPIVAKGAEVIATLAPDYLRALSTTASEDAPSIDANDTASDILEKSGDGSAAEAPKVGEWMNADQLERMIRQTQEKMQKGAASAAEEVE